MKKEFLVEYNPALAQKLLKELADLKIFARLVGEGNINWEDFKKKIAIQELNREN